MKAKELPLLLLITFTLVYSVIGNADSEIWTCAYFLVHYTTLFLLFKHHNSKIIRITGISLSVSSIVYIILNFSGLNSYKELFTLIPFTICLISLILLDKKNKNEVRRKVM